MERNQLADYIVSTYNVIDKTALMSHFEDHAELLKSMHSTTGSEYEIKEDFDTRSDEIYRDMIKVARNIHGLNVRRVIILSKDEKLQLMGEIRRRTAAPLWQIAKFLHIK